MSKIEREGEIETKSEKEKKEKMGERKRER